METTLPPSTKEVDSPSSPTLASTIQSRIATLSSLVLLPGQSTRSSALSKGGAKLSLIDSLSLPPTPPPTPPADGEGLPCPDSPDLSTLYELFVLLIEEDDFTWPWFPHLVSHLAIHFAMEEPNVVVLAAEIVKSHTRLHAQLPRVGRMFAKLAERESLPLLASLQVEIWKAQSPGGVLSTSFPPPVSVGAYTYVEALDLPEGTIRLNFAPQCSVCVPGHVELRFEVFDVEDGSEPWVFFDALIDALYLLHQGHPIAIHCLEGKGRTGAALIVLMMALNPEMSHQDALQSLLVDRPILDVTAHLSWLSSPSTRDWISSIAAQVPL